MKDERQILHFWKNSGDELEFTELSSRFRRYFPDDDMADSVNILQRYGWVKGQLGKYAISKKGGKVGQSVNAPEAPAVNDCKKVTKPAEASPKNEEENDILTTIIKSSSDQSGGNSEDLGSVDSSWKFFRKLIGYYLDCVRCDERPSNVLGGDGLGDTYIPVLTSGPWWPNDLISEVEMTIPTNGSQNPFIRRVLLSNEDFFVGYPFHALGEGDKRIGIPVFCVPVSKISFVKDQLRVQLDFSNADINASWLQKRFKTNEERRAFLVQCGLIDQADEDDVSEEPNEGDLPDQLTLNIEAGVSALSIFCSGLVKEKLSPMVTSPLVSVGDLERGIYNSAVLFSGKKLRFNIGLIRELRKIEKAPDADLNKTALRHFFVNSETELGVTRNANVEHESAPVIPFVPYNYEQEEAVRLALSNDLTVITGPPGTGKSQVVVNILSNLAIHDRTALFASKNHKAIDAVVPRTNSLVSDGQLITRLKNPETGDVFTWRNAVDNIMATSTLPYDESCDQLKGDVIRKLRRRERMMDDAELWSSTEKSLAELNEQLDVASSGLTNYHVKSSLSGDHLVNRKMIDILERQIGMVPSVRPGFYGRIKVWVWGIFSQKKLDESLVNIEEDLMHYQIDRTPPDQLILKKTSLLEMCNKLRKFNSIYELGQKISVAESIAKDVKPLSDCLSELTELMRDVEGSSEELISKTVRNRFSGLDDINLQEMVQMRGILNNMNNAGVGGQAQISWVNFFETSFSKLLKFFPMWAVPNLSVRHGLPLIPGVVDTVIVDEASQCDIVSVIPLLFRAHSAVIVGDPQQLKPVHRMGQGVNMQLLRRHGLTEEKFIFSYSYLDASCYQLAASTPKCNGKVQLKDHYRCHPDIAYYFNDQFYGKSLRVLTNQSNLNVPKGYTVGLMWTDVVDETQKVSARGAICLGEIEAVAKEIKSLLVDREFSGTIGVVAPFKIQADRIRDVVYREVSGKKLNDAQFVCATADSFQGDERDVIIMSCVYQPNLYDGGKWYLTDTQTKNLWNVAVSRARAALHIVGNKEYCKTSGVRHLAALAERCDVDDEPVIPAAQFDSIWERKFHDALKDADIHTVSQYPLAGRRLDLAVPFVNLDIEVDGEKYHKDSSGRRKAEDLWRDLTIQAAGWTPLRFWVYELREDMIGCVEKVRKKIDELSSVNN